MPVLIVIPMEKQMFSETFEVTSPIQIADMNELKTFQANYYIVPMGL